jgi:hypothetical protein
MPKCGRCGGWYDDILIGCVKCGSVSPPPVSRVANNTESPENSPFTGLLSGLFVLIGLMFWWMQWGYIEDLELDTAHTMQGLAYMFWVAAIVVAIHSTGKYIVEHLKK